MTELYEDYLHWMVLVIALLAVKALLGSAAFLFDDAAETLRASERIPGILAGILLFVTGIRFVLRQTRLLWSLAGPSDLRQRGRVRDDGFTFDALKTASFVSVFVTGATLGFLASTLEEPTLPTAFFIRLVFFICTATFSATYLILSFATAGRPTPPDAM